MLKRAFLLLLALVLLLAGAVALNTLRHGSRQLDAEPAPALVVDEAGVASRLAGAVRFKTVSSQDDPDFNADEFRKLHAWLAQSYPAVHAKLERERVGHLGLLYRWSGSDANAAPVLLLAHQDVAPIAPGTEADWQQAPFSGAVQDGFVWGRGAWDDKGNLIAMLEALELLVQSGFEPRRTVYLASGADEEVGGLRDAAEIAKLLQSRGVRPEFVLDEGLLITDGIMPGLAQPAALIGVAEKGYLSTLLEAKATPGHSSMPDPQGGGAVALMSTALARLHAQPMPAALGGVAREMFETIAPEMQGFGRIALSNLWLFGPLVRAQLERAPGTNAVLRTTTALTIVQGGNKDNVIPGRAEAVVNFRLLPGDTRGGVLAHVRETVRDDRIKVSSLPGSAEPSPIAPTSSASYRLLNKTVRSLFPQTLVAPGLMVAATDSRHSSAISEHVYRFSPVRANAEDLKRFHGTNERIATSNLAELVRFYVQLLRNAQAAPA